MLVEGFGNLFALFYNGGNIGEIGQEFIIEILYNSIIKSFFYLLN